MIETQSKHCFDMGIRVRSGYGTDVGLTVVRNICNADVGIVKIRSSYILDVGVMKIRSNCILDGKRMYILHANLPAPPMRN